MGARRDQSKNLKVSQVIDPATLTSDTNGSSVDMQGYGALMFLALVGESGDTLSGSVKIELEVEESSDNSTFTDVADADLVGSVSGSNNGTFAVIDAAAEDDAVYKCGYIGNERYVRPVVNLTGTHTNGTPIGIVAVQGEAEAMPV